MTPEDLTDDAKVILLLCGHFGKGVPVESDASPLGVSDYARFSSFLHDRGLRPASLLGQGVLDNLETGMSPVPILRIRGLLSKGAAMSFAVEGWMNKGLWVLCRSDANYPRRLKRQLREMAPPILFGAGEMSLLDRGGMAIVGSRNIGPEQETFASRVANRCASEGIQVVSGGARGVDRIAMSEALDAGGTVVGVLADSLLKSSLQKANREALHDGRLVLVSAVHPEAGFNVGSAMGRNKFIYALANYALVVQAEFEKGGTWTGAVEELERPGGRPVFFQPGFSPPKAEQALQGKGALPFPSLSAASNLLDALGQFASALPSAGSLENGELRFRESAPEASPTVSEPQVAPPKEVPSQSPVATTVFEVVWPFIRSALSTPLTVADLADAIQVRKAQAEDWVKQASDAGLVKKLSKPTRYVAVEKELFDLK